MAAAPAVLAELRRGPIVEGVVRGHVAVVGRQGQLLAWAGRPDTETTLRSALKPLQAASFAEAGGPAQLGLDDHSLAIACSSHQGEPGHVAAARRILAAAGIPESALGCGAHPPVDPEAARELVRSGLSPTAIHNNCSGKHAALLASCRLRGWPLESYRERQHPLQEEIAARLARHSGKEAGQLRYGIDGCGLPTYGLTLVEFARALVSATAQDPAVQACQAAMAAHPWLVGGSTSFDTAVLRVAGARTSCKGGAAAVFGAVARDASLAVVIKLEAGAPTGLHQVAATTLRRLGLLPEEADDQLRALVATEVRNWAGTEVGEIRSDFSLES
ncbi:MAG: asparaginase [Candidatus Dormibacteria bacterium]